MPDFRFRHLHVLKYDVCTAKAMYPREKCVVWGWQGGRGKTVRRRRSRNTSPGNRKALVKKTCRLLSSMRAMSLFLRIITCVAQGRDCSALISSIHLGVPACSRAGTSRVQSEVYRLSQRSRATRRERGKRQAFPRSCSPFPCTSGVGTTRSITPRTHGQRRGGVFWQACRAEGA